MSGLRLERHNKVLLSSRGVTCWGQGPIGRTGYYKLVETSTHKGDKRLVIVATVESVAVCTDVECAQ